MFGTSTMTPPSIFHLVFSMQCYRLTMPSYKSGISNQDNQREGNDDDSQPPPPLNTSTKHDP